MKSVAKWLRTIVISYAVVALAAGCFQQTGQSSAGKQEPVKPVADAKNAKLTWVGYGYLAGGKSERIIAKWKENHPNIEIEYKEFPNTPKEYFRALDVAVAGNETMDVILMDNLAIAQRATQGMLLDITQLAAKIGLKMDEDFGPAINDVIVDDKHYFLPYTVSMNMLWYNKDMFDAKGIKYPDENTTMQELADMAKKLSSGNGNTKVFGIMNDFLDSASNAGWNWLKDGNVPNFTDPRFKNAVALNKELADSGVSPTNLKKELEKMDQRVLFAQQKTAMMTGNWWTPVLWSMRKLNDGVLGQDSLKFKYGVTFMPRYDASSKAKVSRLGLGWGYSVNSKTKYPEESFLFAKFLSTEIPDLIGAYPAYKQVNKDVFYNIFNEFIDKDKKVHKDLYDKAFLDTIKRIHDETIPSVSVYGPSKEDAAIKAAISDLFLRERPQLELGKISLDDFIKKMQDEARGR